MQFLKSRLLDHHPTPPLLQNAIGAASLCDFFWWKERQHTHTHQKVSMIFLQALSLTQMRHLFFQTSTNSSSLFKESIWITSPPHRSVSYSPWCLFFLFFLGGGGGEGSLSSCTCGRIDFACGFWLQLDLRLLLLRNSILKACCCCCCCCFSKRKLQKPRLKNRRKHNQFLLTHYWNPPCFINSEKRKFCFICLHLFFFVFWGWYTKPEKLMQNSSFKDGEEANSECAKLRKTSFFPQETRKKKLWKKKNRHKQFLHLTFHCTHCYARLWNLSLQQTRNQNQSNEKLELVAKSLRAVSTTKQKQKNQSNQSLKLLPKNSSFNFCFNNTTTRNMKSIKSKLTIVAQKNSSFNFCFNNTTKNMKSIKSKLEIVAQKIQASIFVSTTQLLETWNQSNQSLQLLPKKIQASIFVSTTQLLETWNQSNQIKSKLEFVVKNSSFNFCFNNNTTRNKSNQTNSNVHWKVIEMEGSSFNFHDFLEVVMPMESSSLK